MFTYLIRYVDKNDYNQIKEKYIKDNFVKIKEEILNDGTKEILNIFEIRDITYRFIKKNN